MHTPPTQPYDEASALPDALVSLLEEAHDENGAHALTAVTVDVEVWTPGLSVSLHFANGYELSHLFNRHEARALYLERDVRTRGELQEVLLEEALPVYEQMAEVDLNSESSGEEGVEDENVSILEVGTPTARERGFRLLSLQLTFRQRQQLNRHGYFEVIGGDSGRCYRIWRGRVMNVDQLDSKGRRVCSWCFHPRGQIVTGDIMLAQKLALELDETATLRIAVKERRRSRIPRVALASERYAPEISRRAPPAC
jgi:hypothetical protein